MQIEAARCRDTMLKLYHVRVRNDLKHHHELEKMNLANKRRTAEGARKSRQRMVSKKWAKKDIEKTMQRGDHWDGLVVLIPMVEAVRKTDSVCVQNGQNKKKINGL